MGTICPFGVWRNKSVDPRGSDTQSGQTITMICLRILWPGWNTVGLTIFYLNCTEYGPSYRLHKTIKMVG
jgi:hypothetical protein